MSAVVPVCLQYNKIKNIIYFNILIIYIYNKLYNYKKQIEVCVLCKFAELIEVMEKVESALDEKYCSRSYVLI